MTFYNFTVLMFPALHKKSTCMFYSTHPYMDLSNSDCPSYKASQCRPKSQTEVWDPQNNKTLSLTYNLAINVSYIIPLFSD